MTTTQRQTDPNAATLGRMLRDSREVCSAIGQIVEKVREAQSRITDVRGPTSELKASYEEAMRRAGESRGRDLYYPYLGSGLGAGPLVELADGSVKYDMISGIGVQFFGHSDPGLVEAALEGALSDVVMQGHLQMNEDAAAFAQTLVDQAGRNSDLAHAFLSTSGAMANENALKVCYQKHAPADRVLAFDDCFAGRTLTMSRIGDSPTGRQGLPLHTPVDYVPFFDEAAAEFGGGDLSGPTRAIDRAARRLQEHLDRYPGRHACFVFELVQGEGGFNTAPAEFHRTLMDICKTNGVAVWVDEIQTFGRTPEMFCFETLGLGEHIDVCTVGKMTQVCATLITADYNPKPGLLSGTFLGSSGALRVGRRIIERLRDGGFYGPDGSIARHHRLFREQAEALISRHPEWFPPVEGATDLVGGTGGMMRFTPFGGEKERIVGLCKTMFERGVIAFHCGHGPFHVRLLPPLGAMRENDWPKVFSIIESAMSEAAAG